MGGAANAAPLPLLNLMGCDDFLRLPNFSPALGLGLGLGLGFKVMVRLAWLAASTGASCALAADPDTHGI